MRIYNMGNKKIEEQILDNLIKKGEEFYRKYGDKND